MCGIISLYTPSTRVNAAHAITPGIALFLDHAQALGGAERSLLLLLKHLDRGHWQPHLGHTRRAFQLGRRGRGPRPRTRSLRRASTSRRRQHWCGVW